MNWRESWARNWDRMRYCSKRCRSLRRDARLDLELEGAIEQLLSTHRSGATICPSEAVMLDPHFVPGGVHRLDQEAESR
jgi:hypothetical protein